MSDLESLWRAVLANPDEDTPRLMYADEVQESDPERAELIRAQCEWERLPVVKLSTACRGCGYDPADGYHHNRPDCPVLRSGVLLDANRERWEPACVACGGLKLISGGQFYTDGEVVEDDKITCTNCSGTGRQPCRWERGFPVVQVAQMRQVWERADEGGMCWWWRPTPWLCALLRAHHVAGVVPGDVEPTRTVTGVYMWRSADVTPAVWGHCYQLYATPELATAALGPAVVLAALEWLDAQGET